MGRRPATYQDVIDAPEDHVAEIIGGELWVMSRPAYAHAHTVIELAGDLRGGFGGPDAWRFLVEPELWLGPVEAANTEVLVPDVAAWRRDRFVPPHLHGHTQVPDWVCEVLSPSTVRRDRILKLDVYARVGVPHAWIVDPLEETVEVFALRGGVYARVAAVAGDAEGVLPPFEGRVVTSGWWARVAQ